MSERNNDEFYIGYLKKTPRGLARFIVIATFFITILVLAYAITNHFFRVPFHSGVTSKKYVTLHGVLIAKPYPMLLSERLGKPAKKSGHFAKVSRYYVTPPGKRGLGKVAQKWNQKYVSLGGTLIYRDDQTMFVINKKSIKEINNQKIRKRILKASVETSLGEFSLEGEIVDSKCSLGQMQPGSGKTHRACATLCIRGGIPPLFVTKLPQLGLERLYLILISRKGEPINQQVLDMVAEPLEITGEIIRKDNLYFFESNPKAYKRLSKL